MNTREVSGNLEARQELEDAWRLRLEESRRAYRAASAEYAKLSEIAPNAKQAPVDSPLARARRAESQALLEYSHVLRIFADLTLNTKLPEEGNFPAKHKGTSMISVVDDDESVRDATRKLLRAAGYQVATFESAERFLDSGALGITECVVLDVRMPGMSGLELQRRLNATQSGVPVIFLTAHDDARSRSQALDGGALDFLCKPFEADALVTAIQLAVTRRYADLRER